MKKLIIIINFALPFVVNAQDFHYIYILIDRSMGLTEINQKLTTLTQSIKNKNETFVLFLSNSYPKDTTSDFADLKNIQKEIANISSFTSIDVAEEMNWFFNIFENNDVCQTELDTLENKLRIKPKSDFFAISFDCFVGDDFFDYDYNNSLLAKFLFASDLQRQDFNVDIHFYNTSNLTEEKIRKFDKMYINNNFKIYLD